MKLLNFFVVCFLLVGANSMPAVAQGDGFGIGAIIGEPTGLSLKQWQTRRTAIDAALAWSVSGDNHLYVHADYLVHSYDAFRAHDTLIPLYYGIGGLIRFDDDTRLGVRLPLGASYFIPGAPLDIFLEVAPILELTPTTEFVINGGIGIRFFFR